MDKEESKKNPNYYKNLLDSNDFNEFEEILEFLKEELRNYYVNLEYSEKIIRFSFNWNISYLKQKSHLPKNNTYYKSNKFENI